MKESEWKITIAEDGYRAMWIKLSNGDYFQTISIKSMGENYQDRKAMVGMLLKDLSTKVLRQVENENKN